MPTYFKPNLPQNEKMTHDNSKIRNTKLKNEKKGRTNANDWAIDQNNKYKFIKYLANC